MKRFTLSFSLVISLAVSGLAWPLAALADDISITHQDAGAPLFDVSNLPNLAMSTLTVIAASLSLLYVVIGGLKYVLSSGDPKRINSARQTLTYALVGLTISLLAFAAVHFVLSNLF